MRSFRAAFVFATAAFVSSAAADDSGWPDPVANDVLPYSTAGLSHGPLLGGVTSETVKVWIRTRDPVDFDVVYDKSLPLTGASPSARASTSEQADRTGVVQLNGLEPNTRYFYGIRIGGVLADLRESIDQPWPSFRTLPSDASFHDPKHNPNGLFNFAFAIGHCASQDPDRSGGMYASTPAYDTIWREHLTELSFGIVNGDVIYEERRDGTIEGVRDNYKLYLSRGRSFANLFRALPGFFTFDDHDVGWDLHGSGQIGLGGGRHLMRDVGLKAYEEYLSWANPPGNHRGKIRLGRASVQESGDVLHDPDANFLSLDPQTVSTIHLGSYTRGATSTRSQLTSPNAGVYALKEVLDAHRIQITPTTETSEQLPYSVGTHHYYDWEIGNCHFFALDTRGERSSRNPEDRTDPKLFILSDAQEAWLLDGLKTTNASFIFIISPDPWIIYHTAAHVGGDDRDDKGDGFPSFLDQRERLLNTLDQMRQPVLIFTGDVHAAASVKICDNVWEMMCGPLGSTGHPIGTLGNPPRGGNWLSMGREVQIRWVTGFPNNLPHQRIRNTYYGIVQINNVIETAAPDEGYQFVAYDRPQVIVRWHDGYTGKLVYAESIIASD